MNEYLSHLENGSSEVRSPKVQSTVPQIRGGQTNYLKEGINIGRKTIATRVN